MSLQASEDVLSSPRGFRGRRSRTEMMVDVLRAINGGAERPTRIMYKSNLSWLVSQELLTRLSSKGLIRSYVEGDRRRYLLTRTRLDLLSRFVRAAEEIRT
ncbi:MAG: hypothetical protein KGI38_05910 [Thaumarchaeota archaeon]|nr:hypothetical protein [Nitrososphaerota archaeon]